MRLGAWLLLGAMGLSRSTEAATNPSWTEGRPVAVAVDRGKAEIDVPTRTPASKVLVVVSALAADPGPYSVKLTAAGIKAAELKPARIADDGAVVPHPNPPTALSEPSPQVVNAPPSTRRFYLLVREGDPASPSNYRAIEAELKAVGHRIQVYADRDDSRNINPDTLRDLVATFDDSIEPTTTRLLGRVTDLDGDGRFTVLMSSWLSRFGGGRHSFDGFVRGADFDRGLGAPFSNRCDMMYLNPAMKPGAHLRTVVAHEYTHAATFCRKALAHPIDGRPGPDEEAWLDEAIAHLAEDLHGFSRSNLDYRISAFLSNPERYRLVVPDYFAAKLLRSHGNRGGTYLFLRWCADLHGPDLVTRLVGSSLRGMDNLEAATGATFASLFRRWSVALFLSGLEPQAKADGLFRAFALRGPLDDWMLAGPRSTNVTPGGLTDVWEAAGTSTHYAVVEGSSLGAIRLTVEGPEAARLQVTALTLPVDLARVDLRVRAVAGADGKLCVSATLRERDGVAVRIQALAWEPLVPADDSRSAAFRRDGLDALGIASAFGTSELSAGGTLKSRPIPLPGVARSLGTLVFKVVGIDAKGRRVAGWAEVSPAALADGEDAGGG
ncbi:hypothetical protein EP7_000859 [Isosphaeraceae bacterium EP7]